MAQAKHEIWQYLKIPDFWRKLALRKRNENESLDDFIIRY